MRQSAENTDELSFILMDRCCLLLLAIVVVVVVVRGVIVMVGVLLTLLNSFLSLTNRLIAYTTYGSTTYLTLIRNQQVHQHHTLQQHYTLILKHR